ncbi:MAG TPA: hypothetical protein VLH15_10775 [Dehalococcoidales bacterium]|nr:hypothetical protein [Dehalococcoidales bacterium]
MARYLAPFSLSSWKPRTARLKDLEEGQPFVMLEASNGEAEASGGGGKPIEQPFYNQTRKVLTKSSII